MSQNANLDDPCFIILLEGCFYDFLYFLVFTFGRYIFFSLVEFLCITGCSMFVRIMLLCVNIFHVFSGILYAFFIFSYCFRIVCSYCMLFFINFKMLCIFICCCLSVLLFVHFFHFFFLILAKIGKMARMGNNSDYIDLSDPVDSVSISSVVHSECSVVGVRTLSS